MTRSSPSILFLTCQWSSPTLLSSCRCLQARHSLTVALLHQHICFKSSTQLFWSMSVEVDRHNASILYIGMLCSRHIGVWEYRQYFHPAVSRLRSRFLQMISNHISVLPACAKLGTRPLSRVFSAGAPCQQHRFKSCPWISSSSLSVRAQPPIAHGMPSPWPQTSAPSAVSEYRGTEWFSFQ